MAMHGKKMSILAEHGDAVKLGYRRDEQVRDADTVHALAPQGKAVLHDAMPQVGRVGKQRQGKQPIAQARKGLPGAGGGHQFGNHQIADAHQHSHDAIKR